MPYVCVRVWMCGHCILIGPDRTCLDMLVSYNTPRMHASRTGMHMRPQCAVDTPDKYACRTLMYVYCAPGQGTLILLLASAVEVVLSVVPIVGCNAPGSSAGRQEVLRPLMGRLRCAFLLNVFPDSCLPLTGAMCSPRPAHRTIALCIVRSSVDSGGLMGQKP